MTTETLSRIKEGKIEKGDVLAVAQGAGVMATKRTELIPMCHPISLTGIDIQFSFIDNQHIEIQTRVTTTGSTGVELEALTAASVTALTIYDVCKAMDKSIINWSYLPIKNNRWKKWRFSCGFFKIGVKMNSSSKNLELK